MDEKEIEHHVKSVVGSMKIEGFDMPHESVDRVRKIVSGELDCDDEIAVLWNSTKLQHKRNRPWQSDD